MYDLASPDDASCDSAIGGPRWALPNGSQSESSRAETGA
jgi:hypothetical protein